MVSRPSFLPGWLLGCGLRALPLLPRKLTIYPAPVILILMSIVVQDIEPLLLKGAFCFTLTIVPTLPQLRVGEPMPLAPDLVVPPRLAKANRPSPCTLERVTRALVPLGQGDDERICRSR